jgi:hypothetical protein
MRLVSTVERLTKLGEDLSTLAPRASVGDLPHRRGYNFRNKTDSDRGGDEQLIMTTTTRRVLFCDDEYVLHVL